jgi:SAM-dependent methyltransferase
MLLGKAILRSYVIAILLSAFVAGQGAPEKRRLDVPYVPTTDEGVAAMLTLADIKPSDVVYDLGCGDGRIVIAAAKKFGARGVGVDIDPARIREANENVKKAGVEKLVRFEEKDIFQTDIHDANVVMLFLLNSINLKLRPKLLRELRPGTRIVSNTFDMGDWKPDREAAVDGTDDGTSLSQYLYLWKVPARREQ